MDAPERPVVRRPRFGSWRPGNGVDPKFHKFAVSVLRALYDEVGGPDVSAADKLKIEDAAFDIARLRWLQLDERSVSVDGT